jgi:hypothetical protein
MMYWLEAWFCIPWGLPLIFGKKPHTTTQVGKQKQSQSFITIEIHWGANTKI